MGMKEDLDEVKEEISEMKRENEDVSFAMELLKDQRKQNKRLFVIILVILTMWFATIGYLVYVLNDIGYTEETIEIQEVETIDDSTIKIGDELWEKSN